MTPTNQILQGNCLEIMKSWPDGCIDMVMTSPPYYGLRSYPNSETVWGGDKLYKCVRCQSVIRVDKHDGKVVRILWEKPNISSEQNTENLLPKMRDTVGSERGEMAFTESSEQLGGIKHKLERRDQMGVRIQNDSSSQSPLGEKICFGTQNSNGKSVEQAIEGKRICTPQERDQTRQQSGEFRSGNSSTARRSNVSLLQQKFSSELKCQICSSKNWASVDCQHEWGKLQPPHHPGQKEQTKWQGVDAIVKAGEAPSGQFCHCGAWFGQLGLEPTWQLYVSHLVEIFREVKRVLKKEGSFWLNVGDSYAGGHSGGSIHGGLTKRYEEAGAIPQITQGRPQSKVEDIPQKCQMMIPHRLALALVDDDYDDEYELRTDLDTEEIEQLIGRVKYIETNKQVGEQNAVQGQGERKGISASIFKEVEGITPRPISKTNGGMDIKESGEATRAQQEILLGTSGTGSYSCDEMQRKTPSEAETTGSDSIRGRSSDLSVLRGTTNTVFNSSPCQRRREQTSEADKELRNDLRVAQTCELSKGISDLVYELQLGNRQVRNLPPSRRKVKRGEIPDSLLNFFRCVKQNRWLVRNTAIWYKPNSMPSSVRDRLTNKYEFVFHFVKSKKYYYDLDAVRVPHVSGEIEYRRELRKGKQYDTKLPNYKPCENPGNPLGKNPGDVIKEKMREEAIESGFTEHSANRLITGLHQRRKAGIKIGHPLGTNPGDFWSITTKGFPEAHFAVYPEALCELPIKASCPKGGIVLDVFAGSGTTCVVAQKLGRKWLGIELNPTYVEIAKRRMNHVDRKLEEIT